MLSKSPQKTSKVRYIGQGSLFIMKKREAYRSKLGQSKGQLWYLYPQFAVE